MKDCFERVLFGESLTEMNAAERLSGGEQVSLGIMERHQESRQEIVFAQVSLLRFKVRRLPGSISRQALGNT